MRLALLFSGQGNQQPEHWSRLKETLPEDWASALAGVMPEVWASTQPSVETLQANRIAQPLIFAYQMKLWGQLSPHLPRPIGAAGYSLGEMAACSAAGAFSVTEGIQLCAERAAAMDQCVSGPVGLLAIKGLSSESVKRVTEELGIVVAITNGPDHYVLGGAAGALDQAEMTANQSGATRVVRLGVTTPSHTPWLQRATDEMQSRFGQLVPTRLSFPVFSAIDGQGARGFDQAMAALAKQISTPLNWHACLEALYEMRPDLVLEIGPGNALARMWDECAFGIPVRATDDFRTVDGILRWVDSHA
jgi:[acyl-carrier-protein] S-malonyltransferase